jgi:uncharacterized GH25 family protein
MCFKRECTVENLLNSSCLYGTRIFAAASLMLGIATAAQAHDIWMVTSSAGQQQSAEIVFGDLTGPTLADGKKVVSFDLVTPSGKTDLRASLKEATANGHPVLKTQGFDAASGSVIAVTYDNGFWTRQPQDKLETNASELLIPNGVSPHWTVKWGKTLVGAGAYTIVMGTRLEIVALKDPYKLEKDGSLPVRLLLDGKPFVGAKIAYTNGLDKLPDPQQPTAETSKEGIASVPMHGTGPYLLTVDIETAPMHPALAKLDHLYASLAFDTSK